MRLPRFDILVRRVLAPFLLALLPLLGLLLAWHGWTVIFPEHAFFIGSPSGVWREAVQLGSTGALWSAFRITLFETLCGFLSGTLLGTATGLLVWLGPRTQRVTGYYLAMLGAIPLFAMGPMFVFWFGTGLLPKVVLSFIGTFVVSAAQASAGAADVSRGLVNLGHVYSLRRTEILAKIVAPAALVWVLAGLRLSGGMAILGAVIGEFVSSRDGLGHLIIVAEGLYNVNQLWVGIAGVSVIGLLLLAIAAPIESKASRWKATN